MAPDSYDLKEILEEVREDIKTVSSGVSDINSHLTTLNSKVARNISDIETARVERERLSKIVYRGGGIVVAVIAVLSLLAPIIFY